MLGDVEVPIVIVGFGNAGDVVKCLTALGKQRGCPSIGVFICENGGPAAFDALIEALSSVGGPCAGQPESVDRGAALFLRVRRFQLKAADVPVFVGQARENLGFPGGVNSWIRLFLPERGWDGVWVVNPDTWPAPDALAELVRYADKRGKGMVQSRIMFADRTDITSSRGLKWRKLRAKQIGVDIFAPVSPAPDPDDHERRMESPTGVSFYVTRACIDRIGLMDESYWLYWEDFDWGVRAKAACGIGYAHDSVVPHIGGSSSGASGKRAKRSVAFVYLGNRNKLHFVRQHHPRWFAWTVFVSFLRTSEYLLAGSPGNFAAAVKGLVAGMRGETGRPEVAPNQARM
ncbi:MAG TPA: glycosyltransferase family 2 protein [Roseiarcus sp.]|nr:glycosyltransferase family 2 protein [Roseiarcus sp.]